jgi:hypothetical protein
LAGDVCADLVGGDAAEPADVDGLKLACGHQLVEQAAADAEPLRGLGNGQEQRGLLVGWAVEQVSVFDRLVGNGTESGTVVGAVGGAGRVGGHVVSSGWVPGGFEFLRSATVRRWSPGRG